MSDHAFNVGKVGVCGGCWVGQNKLRVENIQALVFHGAHVEVTGRHDHETLKVKGQTKASFVPSHTGHERVHGVLCFVQVTGANKHLQ